MAVDDNKEFLEELQETLKLSGYKVCTSSDTQGIIEKINDYKPSILLLDLKMAPKSGFQIADEIRHFSKCQNLNIIAMSGYLKDTEYQTLMRMCGIKSFLRKPIYPLNLIAQIELQTKNL